jgi:hypothetical protein
MADVLRNVVLHLNGEQPMLADLYDVPSNSDVGLRCTNLRMMNGKRPIFVESTDAAARTAGISGATRR